MEKAIAERFAIDWHEMDALERIQCVEVLFARLTLEERAELFALLLKGSIKSGDQLSTLSTTEKIWWLEVADALSPAYINALFRAARWMQRASEFE